MTASSCNKGLWRKKERKKEFGVFCTCQAVSSSGDTIGSIDNLRTIGNAQEYIVSLYIRKLYLFEGVVHP